MCRGGQNISLLGGGQGGDTNPIFYCFFPQKTSVDNLIDLIDCDYGIHDITEDLLPDKDIPKHFDYDSHQFQKCILHINKLYTISKFIEVYEK